MIGKMPYAAGFPAVLSLMAFAVFATTSGAQAVPYARSYAKSKAEVEQALKDLQAYSGQKIPILDGFVASVDKPLDHYERGSTNLPSNFFPVIPAPLSSVCLPKSRHGMPIAMSANPDMTSCPLTAALNWICSIVYRKN